MLETYVTSNVIPEIEADIWNCKQPEYMSTLRYLKATQEAALRCGSVYDESRLKDAFMGRLYYSIRFSTRYHEVPMGVPLYKRLQTMLPLSSSHNNVSKVAI